MITPGTNKQPGRQASKQAKKTTTTTDEIGYAASKSVYV